MSENKKPEYVIDVDKVIEKYNQANPELKQLNRKALADKLGVKPQLFSDWKRKKTPKIAGYLIELCNVSGCELKDFVIEKENDV